MKRLIAAAFAATLLLSAGSVMADDAMGTVKSVDMDKHEVTLEDGKMYTFPESVSLADIKEGVKVKIVYSEKDGMNDATEIMIEN